MNNLQLKKPFSVWVLISVSAFSFVFYAYSTGITGKTLKNGNGCECHSPVPFSEVVVQITGPDTLAPGEEAIYTVVMTGGELVRGGTNIAASNGVLAPISADLRFEADELTHFEPKMPQDGAVTFQFNYTAPFSTGTETIYANGNSVNFNGDNTGDKWNFALNKVIEVVSEPATFPLTVNIANGWNMVSVPGLHPVNQNVLTWWSGKDPSAGVYRFQGSYQAVTSVSPSTGYWLKHSGANSYNTGEEWPAGGIITVPHDPIAVNSGWNLIGGYEESVAASGVTTTPPGLISGSIFKYQGGYLPASTIDPGYGYWVKLTGAGEINLQAGTAPQKKSAVKDNTKDFGKIKFSDKSNSGYFLYVSDGETELSDYELPPMPPEGIFDIRYATQRYVENLNSYKEINFSGVQFPLTIKSIGKNLIFSDHSKKELFKLQAGEEITLNTPYEKLFVTEDHSPAGYYLSQNFPNPFNPATSIQFYIPEDTQVKLIIYNALGEKIAEPFNTGLQAGNYTYNWDAKDVTSGIYFYQLITDDFSAVRKMILAR